MKNIQLAIYDITGRLVKTLVEERQEPGVYQLLITKHQLPGSGIYFYRLTSQLEKDQSSLQTISKRMILLR